MIKIYVCDDQEVHLQAITQIIENRIAFEEISMELVLATTNPSELLERFNSQEINVYFLDIDLSDEQYDGLNLALKIRESDPNGFIIFITSHLEFGMLIFEYKIGALNYIVKTADPELLKSKINSTIDTICERTQNSVNQHEQEIKFASGRGDKYILISDLIALELVGNHKLEIVSKHQVFNCNGSLGQFEDELPNHFIRCRRDMLVNLNEVVTCSVKEEMITMSNGFTISCSRWQINKFKPILEKFKKS
ncbi:LytR/AlgR family response regulator transcription factor [Xylocopilactobacillus apis]|uniref:DNA-binding response regulator n=1 Tax=Xylocopilactobacillus apis TaxID=2932183 RepID=A0AAU9CNN0_9LACO|nr:DNA-binding response regulator [Xylocopilactobacillus apis]BDR55552.1 DNA-binding response regulator [Xylocopilactobacillus apis]